MRKLTTSDWYEFRYFKPSEFSYPEKMTYSLLVRLESARMCTRVPFHITGDWREGSLEHSRGEAVDIKAHSSWTRKQIVEALLKAGFPRIGIYDRHIHAGVSLKLPEGIWPGESQ